MKEKTYEERKQELINHFISHWMWVYTTEIKQNFPHSLGQVDIIKDKDGLRGSLNIPGYPISDIEYDAIINEMNDKLNEFISYLVLEEQNKKLEKTIEESNEESLESIDSSQFDNKSVDKLK